MSIGKPATFEKEGPLLLAATLQKVATNRLGSLPLAYCFVKTIFGRSFCYIQRNRKKRMTEARTSDLAALAIFHTKLTGQLRHHSNQTSFSDAFPARLIFDKVSDHSLMSQLSSAN